MSDDTLLEFPCRFPIKAIGPHDGNFEQLILDLIKRHAPDLVRDDLSSNVSRSGNYLAVTANIVAQNQAQLDAIYTDLTASEAVVMAL